MANLIKFIYYKFIICIIYAISFDTKIINVFNRKNIFRKRYNVGNAYNGIDDDRDWDEEKHDTNGNGEPDVGEVNVDEKDEGRLQVNDISLFPIIPTIGFSWEF